MGRTLRRLFSYICKLSYPSALFCHSRIGRRLRHQDSSGLLGYRDVSTTMIYTHVLNRGGRGVRSPVDGLALPPDGRAP